MRRFALLVVAVMASLGAVHVAPAKRSARCDFELWSLKTLSDPQKNLVRLRPRATTIAAINERPMPHPTPNQRNTAYERQVWQVTAQIVEYKLEDDSDIHLVLFSKGAYMIAEIPAEVCLTSATRDRRALATVRRFFLSHCGHPTDSWQPLGAIVQIAGPGFWDFAHFQRGHARNYAELHPVTRFKPLSGCGGVKSQVAIRR